MTAGADPRPAATSPGPVERYLGGRIGERGGCLAVLVDPDRSGPEEIRDAARTGTAGGADLIMVGSSLMLGDGFEDAVTAAQEAGDLPVVLFPGHAGQVTGTADAILLLSLVSGRNPEYLIGQHVAAAPRIHALGLETIPTGYLLVESGGITSVQYMSMTLPIPRTKPDLAVAHALAARYLGMRFLYLEAGSGAALSVPAEMITAVAETAALPLFVGGGIRRPEEARAAIEAGAAVIVVGSVLEGTRDIGLVTAFAEAVHT